MNVKTTEMVHPSICTLDCPDTCSLSVSVQGGRVTAIRGSRANPITAGAICSKVSHYYPGFIHGQRRLTRPLRRVGAPGSHEFQPIGWDEALSEIGQRTLASVNRFGPESVLPLNYAGPHGLLAGKSMDRRFFHRLGASLLDRGPLCAGVLGQAYTSLFGSAPGISPEMIVHADLIVVWGNNVTVSNLHLARLIKQARRGGARLVVIDPKRIQLARHADLYLQIEPGTDTALALALAHELEKCNAIDRRFVSEWVDGYEPFMASARQWSLTDAASECRLDIGELECLLEMLNTASRLSLSVANGLERSRNGGSALRAIMALPALLGQFGRPGAGIVAKSGLALPAAIDQLQRTDLIPSGTRTLNIIDVGRHLVNDDLDPPIRTLFIYNHNPVAVHPGQNLLRQGLARSEVFKVGIEISMTDSMRYCDLILPAASSFEHADLYPAYGHNYLQRAEPVIPSVGESLPNTEIFRRLARAFGFQDSCFDDDDSTLMDQALYPDSGRIGGHRPSRLPLDRAVPVTSDDQQQSILCDTVKPATRSGKIELYSATLQAQYGYGVPRYQRVSRTASFMLITPASSNRTNSTFGGEPEQAEYEVAEIHPDDAASAGISDGNNVQLSNAHGVVRLVARLTDEVPRGVIYSPKGTWLSTSDTGQTVNALIDPQARTDIADGACYNDTFVNLSPA